MTSLQAHKSQRGLKTVPRIQSPTPKCLRQYVQLVKLRNGNTAPSWTERNTAVSPNWVGKEQHVPLVIKTCQSFDKISREESCSYVKIKLTVLFEVSGTAGLVAFWMHITIYRHINRKKKQTHKASKWKLSHYGLAFILKIKRNETMKSKC